MISNQSQHCLRVTDTSTHIITSSKFQQVKFCSKSKIYLVTKHFASKSYCKPKSSSDVLQQNFVLAVPISDHSYAIEIGKIEDLWDFPQSKKRVPTLGQSPGSWRFSTYL